MNAQHIEFADARLTARSSGALWWEAERLLCVADLHLCKSERMARRGGALLPPYETAETIDRLAAEIEALAPARVVCLGDSFDDCTAVDALTQTDKARADRADDGSRLGLDRRQPRSGTAGAGGTASGRVPQRQARVSPYGGGGRLGRGLRPLPPQGPAAGPRRRGHPAVLPARRRAADPAGVRRLHRRPARRPPGAPRPDRPRRAGGADRRDLRHRAAPSPRSGSDDQLRCTARSCAGASGRSRPYTPPSTAP